MSEQKKYAMIEAENFEPGKYRIQALVDIPKWGVKAGDLGGLIDKEENLSQSGDGWVDYSSNVLNRAHVTNGYVQNSTIRDQSRFYEGEIIDSDVSGHTVFFEKTHIEASTVKDCVFRKDVILHETNVKNSIFSGRVVMKFVELKIEKTFEVERDVEWLDVDIAITIGFMGRFSKFEHVKIIANELDTDAVLDIKSAEFIADEMVQILANESSWGYLTQCKGTRGNPIRFRGKSLFIEGAILSGSVRLGGELKIFNSTISDMASVHFNGKIVNCTISEMAKVQSESTRLLILENRILSGEEIVSLTKNDFEKR